MRLIRSNITTKRQTGILFFLMFAVLFLIQVSCRGAQKNRLVTYPAPAGAKKAAGYRVFVNGREIFVYDNPVAAFAYFDFSGRAEVEIRATADVKWVDVRPRRRQITPAWDDSTIRFTLTEPVKISVELNGFFDGSVKPLFLFANAPEKDIPGRDDPDVLFFEGGKIYDVGMLELKRNQTVYIAGGAIVKGCLFASKARHVVIRGRGILDATGILSNIKDGRVPWVRAVNFLRCQDVRVEGITVSNSDTWQVVPVWSEDVTITGVNLISGNPSDDGIDIVRCRNVLIENCFIRVKDDCIAIKALFDDPENRGDSNIVVQHCTLWNAEWGSAMEIGFETRALVMQDITFRDMDIIHVERGAVMSIHNGDEALVRNVHYEDIRIEDPADKLIDIAVFRSQYSRDRPATPTETELLYMHGVWDGVIKVPESDSAYHAKFRGEIRNISFKNIRVTDGKLPFSVICGFDKNHEIRDVVIDGLYLCGKKVRNKSEGRFYIKDAEKISFE